MVYKFHKLTIKNKTPGSALTGANTEVLLDGVNIKGCKSINLNIQARQAAILTLELFIDVNEIDFEVGRLEKVNSLKKSEEPILTEEEWQKINDSATYELSNDSEKLK